MGGSSTPPVTSSQSTTVLSPEQNQLLQLALPGIRDFATQPPPAPYPTGTTVPFSNASSVGQNMAINTANAQGATNAAADSALNRFFTDFWNPGSNPVLQSAQKAAVAPIYENLTQNTLPAIRSEALASGNYSNTGRQIGEGLASTGASRAAGETSAKLAQSTYDTNVNAVLKALGILPGVQQAAYTPSAMLQQTGATQEAKFQDIMNELAARDQYTKMAPFLQSQEILSLLQGVPGSTNVTVGTGATAARPALGMQALGGAASGAALGSSFMPGFGTAAGAGIGALLPFILNSK